MMSSTINVFQRLARQWDQIHPYNAAQILEIQGTPDAAALQGAWHDALEDLGLGRVRADSRTLHYECLNGELNQYGVRFVAPGVSLEDHVSEQLNRPFDNPAEPPFRPFVLVRDGSYYAGIVYHHWIADSVSIRTLLREWFVRLFDSGAARRIPVKLPDGSYRHFFGVAHGGAAVGHGLLAATRWASSLRRARRLDVGNGLNLSVRFALRPMPDGWITAVHAAARRRHVTLNDLFMAAIARVCDQHVPLKSRPRRRGLAIGSIVDLRPYCGTELSDTFGLFLGFTNVVCRPDDLRSAERLVHSIAAQNIQQKHRGIPQASALRMLFGITAGRLMSRQRMAQFYQKHLPLAGGISNVNLNRTWATAYRPAPLLDYIRVSPTGPMMPLVFATTTLGSSFHLALTYRPSVVESRKVDAMVTTFREFLASLC